MIPQRFSFKNTVKRAICQSMPAQQLYTIKLLSKQMLSRDIMELRFEKPPSFTFVPGQFVRFVIPSAELSVFRPFSISSMPSNEYLEFCAKILPDGKASNYFVALTTGDTISISQPQGVFVCQPEPAYTTMFIATGAGVAPIMSMIQHHVSVSTKKIQLLFGVRTPEDVFWTDRLDELSASYPNFTFQLTLSRPSDSWHGLHGRVSDHVTHLSAQSEYYICGSAPMVKDVRSLLLANGVGSRAIHFEIF